MSQTPADTTEPAQVWVTYDRPSMHGYHTGIYAGLDLAKRSCELNVEEWIASPPWDEEDEPRPQMHPVSWTLEPDPGLPEIFHPKVPESSYVWIGRYCDEEPTWYFKITCEPVVHVLSSPGQGATD